MGQSFRELIAWQKAMALVSAIYAATREFPREEIYSLTNQLRRAAVSVPSNIAEGQARHTPRDFLRFLSAARGSTAEIQTQLLVAADLKYIDQVRAEELIDQTASVCMLINRLCASIEQHADRIEMTLKSEKRRTKNEERGTYTR